MKLIMVITGASVSGTIALTGVNINADPLTETISGTGNGTYYSTGAYTSINASGIVITGFTSGSIAITGVFGWNRNFLPAVNPFTLTTEWYPGTDSVCIPYCSWSEATLDFDVEKEFKVMVKGIGQDYMQIGPRNTNPMSVSQVVSLAQPTDTPMSVWECQVYIDGLLSSPGTTLFGDMLSGKITIKNPLKAIHKLNNRQTLSTVYRKKIAVEFEAKIDYTNVLQAEQFRQDFRQYLQLTFTGRNVGAGNLQTVTIIIPFKFTKFDVVSTPSSDYVEATIAGQGEYDGVIGASYKMVWNNAQQPPAYTS